MNASFPHFSDLKIIVLGDVMLDIYYRGGVERISPEAPVPILHVEKKFMRPGGAANVALNLQGLTCQPVLISVRGNDASGKQLSSLLTQRAVPHTLIGTDTQPTTTKTRLIGQGQQLIRMDEESPAPPSDEALSLLMDAFTAHLPEARAVILSDYRKGIFFTDLAPQIIGRCRKENIPVFVDPKGTDWEHYRGSTCITPNLSEFNQLFPGPENAAIPLVAQARQLIEQLALESLLITRGHEGMSCINQDTETHIPARSREIWDVSGAGDTVIATFAAARVSGLSMTDAARLANIAAGVVVEKLGTQSISRAELKHADWDEKAMAAEKIFSADEAAHLVRQWQDAGEQVVFTNGCFDILHAGHIKLLKTAAGEGNKLVVALNSDASVKRLKGPGRPVTTEEERALVMANIRVVDIVVIFDEDTPLPLIRRLQPDILVKGGDYTLDTVVGRREVEDRGGRVVLVPLVAGKSTTRTIAHMKS
ncbi:MAG: bifunctional heptose 7-phosphate kinase/heptose 1-phosphate adenyltransferase [Deltaproteobacteria bacterium]|nr:MAG: bifunctional heptose 7-phosphate kinase/heptose 1-phosphate adenyltransferase [Deltaproteobacteria bacterium]